MGTHCLVALKQENGYEVIWVRWDGYTSGVGKTLMENFNTRELAGELVGLGNCEKIADTTNINEVKAYHKDYGGPWSASQSKFCSELRDFINAQSFVYIFQDDAWYVSTYSSENIIPVRYALMEDDKLEELIINLWDDWNFGKGEQKTKDLFDALCIERDIRKEDV